MNIPSLPAHSPARAILPLCLGLLLMAVGSSPASPTFRYREQTGGEAFTFSWQADRDQGGATVAVTQRQGDEIFSSVNTAEGTTLSWRYVKLPDTDVRAERVGDRIRFSGAFAGKVVDKSEPVDSRPWWQPLSFCLQEMIGRGQRQAQFWTIRPDTLDVLAMQAEHADGGPRPLPDAADRAANKVIIRLAGLRSPLWSAAYWFRPGDNLFVEYRGTHGPPGTAETRICLIDP